MSAIAAVIVAASGAGGARAATDLSAGAAVGIERNSNPLELNGERTQLLAADGESRRDTSRHISANLAIQTGDERGPSQLQLLAQISHFDYLHFDGFDHNEHNLTGTLDWRPSRVFDISVQGLEQRVPAGTADIGGDKIPLLTTHAAQTTLRLRPLPLWQLGLTPGWSLHEQPLPTAPDFRYRETTGKAALDYLGAGEVVPGLAATEVHGRYSDIDNATRYRQQTVEATVSYKATGFSTFLLTAGHTTRTTHLITPSQDPLALATEGSNSAFTGTIGYRRQVSVKTEINIGAFRNFQNYDAGVNTQIGTGFNAEVIWNATAKMSLELNADQTWTTIHGIQGGPGDEMRKDVVHNYSAQIRYLATRRLGLRGYFTRQVRTSNIMFSQFNKSIAGLELTATFD